jgi:hypothetical protein
VTILTVHVPNTEANRYAPQDLRVRDRWLRELGPTALWFLVLLHEHLELAHFGAGDTFSLDMVGWARQLGVAPAVLDRTLGRLHRRRIVFYSPEHDLLMADGTLPA